MKKIKLNKGKYAIVDNEDFEYLNQWKWYLSADGYANRSKHVKLGINKYTSKTIRMHRLINNTPNNLFTDHINMDKLDNRKINLRNADKSVNGLNRGKNKNNTSGHKGIYKDSFTGKWKAELMIKGKKISIGRFINIKDAVLARKKILYKLT